MADFVNSSHREPSAQWDKNSTTAAPAPPPCAVLITGFPGSTTSDQLHRHFATYGRIELLEVKVDPATGGSLGVCWCRFFDEFPRDGHPSTSSSASGTTSIGRTGGEGAMSRSAQMESYKRELKKGLAQDGNQVALNAISTGNGQRIGTRMMMTSAGVSVVMDGEGKLCKAAVQDELEKKKKKLSETNELEKKKRMDASVNAAPTTASVSGSTPLTPVSMSSAAAPRSTYNDLHAASSSQSLYRPTTSTFAAPGPPSNHQHASHSHAYGARTAISISTRQVPSHPQSYPFPASGASDRFAPSIAPSGSRSMRPISEASAPTLQHPSVHSASLPPRPRRNVISPNRRVLAPHSPTNLTSSSHRNVNGSSTGGSQPTSMKLAVAAAVEQAKKRHEQEKLKERRDAADNVDMDLGSSHDGDSSDGDGEEEEEQVFFHHYRSGPPSRGGPSAASHLPLKPTLASAASMEWQASSVALREKLVLNGNAYLAISKKDFYAARTTRDDTYAPAPLSTSDLARFFGKHPMAQVSFHWTFSPRGFRSRVANSVYFSRLCHARCWSTNKVGISHSHLLVLPALPTLRCISALSQAHHFRSPIANLDPLHLSHSLLPSLIRREVLPPVANSVYPIVPLLDHLRRRERRYLHGRRK